MPDELWESAVSVDGLKAGWHLTRAETRADFIQDYLLVESFGYNLDHHVRELRRQLLTDTYEPRLPIRVEVPKAALGIRPGSLLSLHDRVVLFSIVKVIAPKLDAHLSEGVYSYRIKENPTKDSLFNESDVLSIPFLKKGTIQEQVDPFEPWYDLWPEFTEETKKTIAGDWRYMSVSDIAAYFENISLPILRDQLLGFLPQEHRVVNTICRCFEAWAVKTSDGFRPLRGIPQGSNICSFFGNLFLLPIDRYFSSSFKAGEIKYFRYMDDIRIFSKEDSVARAAIFDLERQIRRLHLNVQSAKTKILDENSKEISESLIDDRIEKIKLIRDDENLIAERRANIVKLMTIAQAQPARTGATRLIDSKRKKDDLTLRAFRLWCNTLLALRDGCFLPYLRPEIERNSDYKLTRILTNSCRTFPRRRSLAEFVDRYIQSKFNVFPYQEAEFLHSLRYLSRLSAGHRRMAIQNILDPKKYFYIRVQSCLLAGRMRLTSDQLNRIRALLTNETDEHVLTYLSVPLAQSDDYVAEDVIRYYSHHPNPRMAMIGQHLASIQRDLSYSRRFMDHVFQKNAEMRICDYVGILWYIAKSSDKNILQGLVDRIDQFGSVHQVMDLRSVLGEIADTAAARLESTTQNFLL